MCVIGRIFEFLSDEQAMSSEQYRTTTTTTEYVELLLCTKCNRILDYSHFAMTLFFLITSDLLVLQ